MNSCGGVTTFFSVKNTSASATLPVTQNVGSEMDSSLVESLRKLQKAKVPNNIHIFGWKLLFLGCLLD